MAVSVLAPGIGELQDMSTPDPRPRYSFTTAMAPEEVVGRIGERLRTGNPEHLWMKDTERRLVLGYPQRSAHAWSPRMDMELEPIDVGCTEVCCLVGPTPGIWMLFIAGQLVLSLVALTGATLGVAQRSLGQVAWGFWAVPVGLGGMVALYLLARAGRRRAASEAARLKHVVNEALGSECLAEVTGEG